MRAERTAARPEAASVTRAHNMSSPPSSTICPQHHVEGGTHREVCFRYEQSHREMEIVVQTLCQADSQSLGHVLGAIESVLEQRCILCGGGAKGACTRCGVLYCGPECQATDWKHHKHRCNRWTKLFARALKLSEQIAEFEPLPRMLVLSSQQASCSDTYNAIFETYSEVAGLCHQRVVEPVLLPWSLVVVVDGALHHNFAKECFDFSSSVTLKPKQYSDLRFLAGSWPMGLLVGDAFAKTCNRAFNNHFRSMVRFSRNYDVRHMQHDCWLCLDNFKVGFDFFGCGHPVCDMCRQDVIQLRQCGCCRAELYIEPEACLQSNMSLVKRVLNHID